MHFFFPPETNAPDGRLRKLPERTFRWLLVTVAFASLGAMLIFGSAAHIEYDGYWHLFIDSQDRWRMFITEYRNDAHPILYHLVLWVLVRLGHAALLYRSASIVPAAIAVYLLGRIAERLCINRRVALLAAAAYGFSWVMLGINIDVRSYALCLAFVLAAFLQYVELFVGSFNDAPNRSMVRFAVYASLAIATEYYAVFFWLACLVMFAVNAAIRPSSLRFPRPWAKGNRRAALIAACLPLLTIGYFYRTHIRYQPRTYDHVSDYYWKAVPSPSVPSVVSAAQFVLRNLRSDLNFVLPMPLPSLRWMLAFLLITISMAVYLFATARGSIPKRAAALPLFILVLLLCQIAAGGVLDLYPFGGFDRQQSIFFPFAFLSCFVLLDLVLQKLNWQWGQNAVAGTITLLIAGSFVARWHTAWSQRRPDELACREYTTFKAKLAPAPGQYIDQFTLILFYIYTRDWHWHFKRHLYEPGRIDEYQLTSPAGQQLTLLRNPDYWNFDLRSAQVYHELFRSLHDAGLERANIFLVKQAKGPFSATGISSEEETIAELAWQSGLTVTAIYDNSEQIDIAVAITTVGKL